MCLITDSFISVADEVSSLQAVPGDPVVGVMFGQGSTVFPLGRTVRQHGLVLQLLSVGPPPLPSQEAQARPNLRNIRQALRVTPPFKMVLSVTAHSFIHITLAWR